MSKASDDSNPEDLSAENAKLREALRKLSDISKKDFEAQSKQIKELQSKLSENDGLQKEVAILRKKNVDLNEKVEELQQVSYGCNLCC